MAVKRFWFDGTLNLMMPCDTLLWEIISDQNNQDEHLIFQFHLTWIEVIFFVPNQTKSRERLLVFLRSTFSWCSVAPEPMLPHLPIGPSVGLSVCLCGQGDVQYVSWPVQPHAVHHWAAAPRPVLLQGVSAGSSRDLNLQPSNMLSLYYDNFIYTGAFQNKATKCFNVNK